MKRQYEKQKEHRKRRKERRKNHSSAIIRQFEFLAQDFC